jgi:protein TonB
LNVFQKKIHLLDYTAMKRVFEIHPYPGRFRIDVPLLGCIMLSVAIHAFALFAKGIYTAPQPRFETGRTVIQLTLAPSLASQASTPESVEAVPIPAPAPQPVAPSRPEPLSEQQTANAPERNASLIEDKGVVTEASAASSIRPVYPRISRLCGEEGEVMLRVEVSASGRAGAVDVVQTSGYRRLDEAACKAARNASFNPARQLGRAVDSVIELSFTFTLTDD